MSELRRDPILRRWVIMAPERAAELVPRRGEPPAPRRDTAGPCPFCPGSEALNPAEIAVVRDGQAWAVRVTPDKEPLLRIEGELGRRAAGMFDLMNAIGAHELVTDVPAHTVAWADFPVPQMIRLLEVYRDRTRDLRRDPRFRFVLVLKNHGAIWSRYGHSHSHVVATPFTPKRIEEEIAGAREYHRMRERCVFCDQITEELRAEARVVARNADFVTFAPFASEHPYETWVVPLEHAADFGTLSDNALGSLAEFLVDALARLHRATGLDLARDANFVMSFRNVGGMGGRAIRSVRRVTHVCRECGEHSVIAKTTPWPDRWTCPWCGRENPLGGPR